jgi:hypothetical protein
MRLAVVIAACALGIAWQGVPAPAAASDAWVTLPMADVLRRARSNPVIKLQARMQLRRANIALDDVFCRANKLDASWGRLADTVVAPYTCVIGTQTVLVTSHLRFTDAAGVRVPSIAADLKSKAVAVTEVRFRWRWLRSGAGVAR